MSFAYPFDKYECTIQNFYIVIAIAAKFNQASIREMGEVLVQLGLE